MKTGIAKQKGKAQTSNLLERRAMRLPKGDLDAITVKPTVNNLVIDTKDKSTPADPRLRLAIGKYDLDLYTDYSLTCPKTKASSTSLSEVEKV